MREGKGVGKERCYICCTHSAVHTQLYTHSCTHVHSCTHSHSCSRTHTAVHTVSVSVSLPPGLHNTAPGRKFFFGSELATLDPTGGRRQWWSLHEVLTRLREVYTGTLTAEFNHITSRHKKDWLMVGRIGLLPFPPFPCPPKPDTRTSTSASAAVL